MSTAFVGRFDRFGRLDRARRWAAIILPIALGAAVGLAIFKPSFGGTDYNRGFRQVGPMTTEREWPSTALLPDGRVLIAGGGNANTQLASAEVFDPLSGRFHPTGSMSEARQGAPAVVLRDGRVLVIGMTSGSCDLYDATTGTFSPTGKMAEPHGSGTATLLPDGRVLVAGGVHGDAPVLVAELFDPATGTFSATGSLTSPRAWATATLLSDGRVLVAGGGNQDGKKQTSAELYDPRTGTFSPTGAMAMSHDPQTAVALADGRAMVIGGGQYTLDSPPAEIFDPKSGQFSDAGSIDGSSQRLEDVYHFYYYDPPPVRLGDGRVLFWSPGSSTFRFYDPQTGKISIFGRFDPDLAGPVVLLSDGQVLFAGGETMLDIKGAYLYRP